MFFGVAGAHTIQDSYTQDFLRGHYMHVAGMTGYYHNSSIASSTLKNNITIYQTNWNEAGNVATYGPTVITSYDFYRDSGWTGGSTATVSSVVLSGVTGVVGYTPVTGIYLASANQLGLTATTDVNRLGQFFYRNGTLLSYNPKSGLIGATAINGNITQMPSNYLDNSAGYTAIKETNLRFTNPITFSYPNNYGNECNVIATPFNWMGETGATASSNSLYAVFDPKTLALINDTSKYPSSVLTPFIGSSSNQITGSTAYGQVTTQLTPGFRIWSEMRGSTGPGPTDLPKASGFTYIPYDQKWNIGSTGNAVSGFFNGDATKELALYNGLYVSGSVPFNSYRNYNSPNLYFPRISDIASFQPDYSAIGTAGKRYATFVWSYTNLLNVQQKLLYAKFIIYGCTKQLTNFTDDENDEKVKLFFRIEYPFATSVSGGIYDNKKNTTWHYAYKNPDGNYYNTTILAGGKDASKTFTSVGSGTNYTTTFYTQYIIENLDSGDNILLYATVEVPMNLDFGFSHITAGLFY
jgi:hypothetical protein